MLWAQGCPISPDDLGRDQMSAGADSDLVGLQLGRWALRQLEGQGQHPDDLAGFWPPVGRAVGIGRLVGSAADRREDFDAAAAGFNSNGHRATGGPRSQRDDLHGRALWRLSDLSPETDLVESAVWAARRMALSSSALFFARR